MITLVHENDLYFLWSNTQSVCLIFNQTCRKVIKYIYSEYVLRLVYHLSFAIEVNLNDRELRSQSNFNFSYYWNSGEITDHKTPIRVGGR